MFTSPGTTSADGRLARYWSISPFTTQSWPSRLVPLKPAVSTATNGFGLSSRSPTTFVMSSPTISGVHPDRTTKRSPSSTFRAFRMVISSLSSPPKMVSCSEMLVHG